MGESAVVLPGPCCKFQLLDITRLRSVRMSTRASIAFKKGKTEGPMTVPRTMGF